MAKHRRKDERTKQRRMFKPLSRKELNKPNRQQRTLTMLAKLLNA
jgi:hypothetical protein